MKLAEALLLRADMNVELGRLGRRLARNARVEKGSVPGEDPLVLLEEALRVVREREALMIRINITKMQTRLPNGMSLMAALARRSRLESERTLVLETIGKAEVANPPRERQDKHSYLSWMDFGGQPEKRPAIRKICQLDIQKLQARVDNLTKRIRELNALIQAANWTAVLP